jgi:hypothetical protein
VAERTPSADRQVARQCPPSALSAAVSVVTACLSARRREMPQRAVRDLVTEVAPEAAAFARLAVLLIERTPDATETLRAIALEAARS